MSFFFSKKKNLIAVQNIYFVSTLPLNTCKIPLSTALITSYTCIYHTATSSFHVRFLPQTCVPGDSRDHNSPKLTDFRELVFANHGKVVALASISKGMGKSAVRSKYAV